MTARDPRQRAPGAWADLRRWARRHRPAAMLLVSALAGLAWLGTHHLGERQTALEQAERRAAAFEVRASEMQVRLERAEAARLASQAEVQLDEDPTLALQLALEAARRQVSATTRNALYAALGRVHEVARVYAFDGDVEGAALEPRGTRLLAWDRSGLVLVSSQEDGAVLARLLGHAGAVRNAAWTHTPEAEGARRVVSAGDDGTVRVWDPRASHALHVVPGDVGPLVALAVDEAGRLALVGGTSGKALCVDLERGEVSSTLEGHEGPVEGVAISPDGGEVATIGADRTVRRWDPRTGEETDRFTESELPAGFGRSPLGGRVAYASGGEIVVAWFPDGVVQAWRPDDAAGTRFGDSRTGCAPFALAAGSARVLVYARAREAPPPTPPTAFVFDLATKQGVGRFVGLPALPLDAPLALDSAATRLALTTSLRGDVAVREVDGGALIAAWPGPGVLWRSLCFDGDARRLLAVGRDRTVRLFAVEPGPVLDGLRRGAQREVVALAPGGEKALVRTHGTAAHEAAFEVVDLATGTTLREVEAHVGSGPPVFDPTGSWLGFSDSATTMRVVSADDEEDPGRVMDISGDAVRVALGPAGRRLAVATADGRVLVGEAGRLELLDAGAPMARAPRVLVFDGSAARLAVVGAGDAREVLLFGVAQGASAGPVRARVPAAAALSACFLPEGSEMLVADEDGGLHRFDVRSGERLGSRTGLPPARGGLVVAGGDAQVAVVAADRLVLLDTEGLAPWGEIRVGDEEILAATTTADDASWAVLEASGRVRLWPRDPVEGAARRLPALLAPRDLQTQQVALGVELLERAARYVDAQPSARAAYGLGRAEVEAGRLERAEARFEEAQRLRPDLPLGPYGLALLACARAACEFRGTPLHEDAVERALQHLKEALTRPGLEVEEVRGDPLLAPLRSSPALEALLSGGLGAEAEANR